MANATRLETLENAQMANTNTGNHILAARYKVLGMKKG